MRRGIWVHLRKLASVHPLTVESVFARKVRPEVVFMVRETGSTEDGDRDMDDPFFCGNPKQ